MQDQDKEEIIMDMGIKDMGIEQEGSEEQMQNYVDYALGILEENPETLETTINEDGIDIGVPSYVASIISKIDNIDLGNAIVVATTLLDTIDKIITESGQQLPEEQRMTMITNTIKRMLEIVPQLGEQANTLIDESDLERDEQSEEPQGVL